jgi:hypothetical protein
LNALQADRFSVMFAVKAVCGKACKMGSDSSRYIKIMGDKSD